jgi:hypothetical protein
VGVVVVVRVVVGELVTVEVGVVDCDVVAVVVWLKVAVDVTVLDNVVVCDDVCVVPHINHNKKQGHDRNNRTLTNTLLCSHSRAYLEK